MLMFECRRSLDNAKYNILYYFSLFCKMRIFWNVKVDWPSLKKVTFFNEGFGGGVSSVRVVSEPSLVVVSVRVGFSLSVEWKG